jgi:hypothetical protein
VNTTAKTPAPRLEPTTVVPSLGHLAFEIGVPADWQKLPLPEETVDFDEPTAFLPLGVFMATYGAIVFSVAARPAYEDGNVQLWLDFLCREQGFSMGESSTVQIGSLMAVERRGTQATDVGTMRLRIVAAEDGGRFVTITCMAPEALWAAVSDTFSAMLHSFRLLDLRGPTVPIDTDGPA